MTQQTRRRLILILVVAAISLALDQGAKQWARAALMGEPLVQVIPGYLDLEYHENPGAAFGLMRNVPGARYLLLVIGLVALLLVWRMVWHLSQGQRSADVAFALVVGGALGNLVDRVYIGRVVDFVVMHWQRRYIWPAYNVADAALVAGVILLLLVLGRKPEGEAPAEQDRGRGGKRRR